MGDFHCKTCANGSVQLERLEKISLGFESGENLDCVDKFCYLGNMIGAGAEESYRARVRCAWAKFRELVPVLTFRGASMEVKGKVYKACVHRVLVYGSETWLIKAEDMQQLERTERMMVRCMCGASLESRTSSYDLNKRLYVEAVTDAVRHGSLRCFGHLEHKDINDCVLL